MFLEESSPLKLLPSPANKFWLELVTASRQVNNDFYSSHHAIDLMEWAQAEIEKEARAGNATKKQTLKRYLTSESTIKRDLKSGKLKSLRGKATFKNSEHRFAVANLDDLYARKS